MLPTGLKKDKNGLLYLADDRIFLHHPLLIDHRNLSENRYYQNIFYALPGTDEYIIKFSITGLTRKERKAYLEMLANLVSKQSMVTKVDFPIAYFKSCNRFAGLIVKYYKDATPYNEILDKEDINVLNKYYLHDEDSLHNMFILFSDVLDKAYEMFENGVYFSDFNQSNIVFINNEAKLIDFDPRFVKFNDKDLGLHNVMVGYHYFLEKVLFRYHYLEELDEEFNDFEDAKTFIKKMENDIRRG